MRTAVIVVALGLVLGACGGDDDAPPATTTSSTTSTSTTTTTPTPAGVCPEPVIGDVMTGVNGGAWSAGYAYVPDGRDEIVERLREACGDLDVTIERGTEIEPVEG